MNLPDYFLADLPPEAVISPAMVGEACRAIKSNRRKYVADLPTERTLHTLSELAAEWLDAASPFRKLTLEKGPAATGFPREVLTEGLDAFFAQITEENLRTLVVQDLGHPQRLERLSASEAEQKSDRYSQARGPELLAHIAGGSLPNPVLASVLLGLLAGAAQFVKCATGTSFIPRMFGHSLHAIEPKLAACLEIAEWKGGAVSLEDAVFAEADCVTVTGDDTTLAVLRQRVPGQVRFLGYGHRVSFAFVSSEALSVPNPRRLAAAAARDISAWNQQGCLSPHAVYVETGARTSPVQFAELLAEELTAREQACPRGSLPPQEAGAIAARRVFYQVRAAHSSDTRLWASPDSTAWTVLYENDPRFQLSCLNRFIYVKAVADLTQALQGADAMRGKVSTVGLAAYGNRAQGLASQLAAWGVTRVCPLGQMQNPPLTWRHDGRPSLGDLVTWTDWEVLAPM